MTDKIKRKFGTVAVHSGSIPEDKTGSVTTPIYPSSTFKMDYPGDDSGYVYSRWSNPTRLALEKTLAELEGGKVGLAFASGLAACGAVMNLLKSGDHVVAIEDLYGGSHRLFDQLLAPHYNLQFTYIDGGNPEEFRSAIKENTKLFWIETPSNPLMKLIDIEKVATIAREKDILLAVDNTFATPYIQNPLELGAHIVHHSMSKYLGGHADVIAGALVSSEDELSDKLRFNQYAVGATLGPFESWLILRGIKTLHIRMEQHSKSALHIADYLDSQKMVKRVYYPGFDGQPLPNRMRLAGGMLSFELDADFENVKKFVMSTKLFVLAESLGGVESLVNHPASMTHSSIPKEEREANGVSDQLIRLSVGIEDCEDLLDDLKSAFSLLK